ncbi:hypothetical protein DPX16_18261 [Anabarilius grahami]|uniref:Uncharacterized protein n=1 Tax=Anabarilius grahami TaxID=495550 RepID=A0A3N0YFC9_ANAGA|nr:hypothetical protein DPX16_18261 [Anabarilius grahami]
MLFCGVFCRIIAAHDKALGSISLQPRLGKPCAACDNGALPYEYDHRISVSLAHQSLLALVGESDNLQEIPLNLNSAGWIKKYPGVHICVDDIGGCPLTELCNILCRCLVCLAPEKWPRADGPPCVCADRCE